MVVTDTFIFLHLQKCGGSFIRDFMLENIPTSVKIDPQHDGYSTIKPSDLNKPVIGIIRNPWNWYVSIYHYHLPSKGSFLSPLVQGKTFKEFIKLFLTKNTGVIHNLNFNWMDKMNVGPFTYRVIRTFNKTGLNIKSIDDIDFSNVTIINMENDLVTNFIKGLADNNIILSKVSEHKLKNIKKVNTSNRDNDYRKYYDNETRDLVSEKDSLVTELFEYKF